MITEKLDALRQSAVAVVVYLFYFQPITDIRMGGSKRDAIKLLRGFAQTFQAKNVNVVTTMWNTLWTAKHIEDANHRKQILKAEIFKRSGDLSMSVSDFQITQESALSVMDNAWGAWTHKTITSIKLTPEFKALARNNLIQRMENTYLHLQSLAADKKTEIATGNERSELIDIVERDEVVALDMLQSLLDELYDIHPESCFCSYPRSSAIPPVTSPSSPRKSMAFRVAVLTSPIKELFRKKK